MSNSYRPLWHLVRVAKPSGVLLSMAAIIAVLAVSGTLCFPILARRLVDELAAGRAAPSSIVALAGTLVGATIGLAFSAYLHGRVGYELVASLRGKLIDKMLKLRVDSFDRESSGERVSRVISDCESISDLATRQAINVLMGVLMLVGSIVLMALLDVTLTLALLGCVFAAFAVVIPVALLLDQLSRRIQDHTAKLSGVLTHVFSEIRLVKAFTAEQRERERSRAEIEGIKRLGLSVAKVNVSLAPLMSLAISAAIVFILVYGTARAGRGEISIGTLTAFLLYVFNVANPLIQLANFAADLQKAKGATSRISAILDDANEEPSSGDLPGRSQAALEFRSVSFAYPGQDAAVLHDVEIAFRPGTTTALVGASGNGKTTILSLIERFYEPTRGVILHDGRPISEYALAAWRARIGYVAQGAPIMPGSVRDNITYGMTSECSDEMVRLAAERAGALSFIERMPQGLDTQLIEQGNNLSGGQRQRIAIARMFLRNPDVLILDEATSHLDSETEHQVKTALESLMRNRTNIVVAHRLATVMHADRIYFLEGGRVSGVGNHDELLATHPYYARLVERQFQRPMARSVLERAQ